jgi:N-acetylmuramoyl-L-alanine amidase
MYFAGKNTRGFGRHVRPVRYLFTLYVILCLLSGATSYAQKDSGPKALLESADKCRKSLYSSGAKKKYRHHWLNCINRYQKLAKSYPKSDEAAWALYHSGRLYRGLHRFSGLQRDLDTSIDMFERLVSEYPNHRLADDAQYEIGLIYYQDKRELTQAYIEFLKVDIKYPSGDMRPKAKAMLDKLSLTLRKERGGVKTVQRSSEKDGLVRVDQIRHWSTPTYTRVVIDIDRPIKYESHLLKPDPDQNKPRRLYVDLKGAYVSADIDSTISIRDGLLQTARAGQYKIDTVRVVLDINSFGGYKIFHLHDPFRIVVDVQGQSKGPTKTIQTAEAKKRSARKGIRKPDGPEQDVSLAQQLGLNVKRIVIDPGHGGKDPGTYYKGGIKEKDIVLKLAKVVAQKIESRLRCEAILTRKTDRFIPLERRTAFANVQKADLFVSLHINAHRKSSISGIETYYLNMATDERAVMVAAMENATSEKNISDLQTILNDLMLNTKISESSRLAYEVQKGMVDKARSRYKSVKSLGVKQAPFYVLIGAEMPAILSEIGFMTNSTERKRLLKATYLNLLADGVVSGIDRYVKSIDQAYGG